MRGYERSGVAEAIRAAGGEVYAVTSEPQSLASEARQTWSLSFECVGDPHHEILASCRARGWLDLTLMEPTLLEQARSWVAHPKGVFQPGVLALTGSGRVLYRWRSRPSRENIGGAVGRPTHDHVWRRVQARLADDSPGDAPLDDAPELEGPPPSWPLFLLLLMAHGWFLRPRPFAVPRPGDSGHDDPRRVLPRVGLFGAAWIAAFLLLPPLAVALALAAWLGWAWWALREVRHRFGRTSREAAPL